MHRRSRLGAGQVEGVLSDLKQRWSEHLGGVWEALARQSVGRLALAGEAWLPGQRWWGAGIDRQRLELDVVAQHATDAARVLVGEVKLRATPREVPRLCAELADRARRCPAITGKKLEMRLWVLEGVASGPDVVTGAEVVGLAVPGAA